MSEDVLMTELTSKATGDSKNEKAWWDSTQSQLLQEDADAAAALSAPLSPMSYAFLPASNQKLFDFDNPTLNTPSPSQLPSSSLDNCPAGIDNQQFSDSVAINKSKVMNINDLEVVDCESENSMTSDEEIEEKFEPKAHVGWASFAKNIAPDQQKPVAIPKVVATTSTTKKKYYVVKATQKYDPAKNYKIGSLPSTQNYQYASAIPAKENMSIAQPAANISTQESSNNDGLDQSRNRNEGEGIPAIMMEDEEMNDGSLLCISPEPKKRAENGSNDLKDQNLNVAVSDNQFDNNDNDSSSTPPNLPPQRPQNSRYEAMRYRKEMAIRRSIESNEEQLFRKRIRLNASPPPFLEPQVDEAEYMMNFTDNNNKNSNNQEEEDEEDTDIDVVLCDEPTTKTTPKFINLDTKQMLKTKISSSSIPILPLSKSIMERKKAAVEVSKHVRKVSKTGRNSINMSVAPKDVQVPAYAERTSMTLYATGIKTQPAQNLKNLPVAVYKNPFSNIDMSQFKFTDDSSKISVRAHLCDQTRVMIARIAQWNREYSKRLGENVQGTCWSKPDEVTAQMTGFCSATVRRCMEIANLAIVPKCADRVGISKNDLTTLKKAFVDDQTFYGQRMRDPHVLTQFYRINSTSTVQPSMKINEPSVQGNRVEEVATTPKEVTISTRSEEKDKIVIPLVGRPLPAAQPPPLMASKRPLLRWNTIQASRSTMPLAQTPITPLTATIDRPKQYLYVKPMINGSRMIRNHQATTSAIGQQFVKRGRGRPKKEKVEVVKVEKKERLRRNPRRTKKAIEYDTIRSVVDEMIDTVIVNEQE